MEQRKVSSPLTAEAFTKLRATFPGLRIIDMHWVSHSRGLARAGLQRHGWYLLAATKLPMTLGPMPPASSCVAFYATLAFACQTGWDLELWDAQSATCRPKASPVSLCCACQGSIHRPARNKAILCGQTAADTGPRMLAATGIATSCARSDPRTSERAPLSAGSTPCVTSMGLALLCARTSTTLQLRSAERRTVPRQRWHTSRASCIWSAPRITYIAGRPWRSSKIGSLCGRLPLSLQ